MQTGFRALAMKNYRTAPNFNFGPCYSVDFIPNFCMQCVECIIRFNKDRIHRPIKRGRGKCVVKKVRVLAVAGAVIRHADVPFQNMRLSHAGLKGGVPYTYGADVAKIRPE
jgi:hypothetical protein